MSVQVGTNQIDLDEHWFGGLYFCGHVDRPSSDILTIDGLAKIFLENLGLKLIPDKSLTAVYQKPEFAREAENKISILKMAGKHEEYRKKSTWIRGVELSERRKSMIDYRFEKFGIEPDSMLNEFKPH